MMCNTWFYSDTTDVISVLVLPYNYGNMETDAGIKGLPRATIKTNQTQANAFDAWTLKATPNDASSVKLA